MRTTRRRGEALRRVLLSVGLGLIVLSTAYLLYASLQRVGEAGGAALLLAPAGMLALLLLMAGRGLPRRAGRLQGLLLLAGGLLLAGVVAYALYAAGRELRSFDPLEIFTFLGLLGVLLVLVASLARQWS